MLKPPLGSKSNDCSLTISFSFCKTHATRAEYAEVRGIDLLHGQHAALGAVAAALRAYVAPAPPHPAHAHVLFRRGAGEGVGYYYKVTPVTVPTDITRSYYLHYECDDNKI